MVVEELNRGMQPAEKEDTPAVEIHRPEAERNFSLHVSGARPGRLSALWQK